MAVITLLRGEQALVDDEDLEKISGFVWRAGTKGYVQASKGRGSVYLHRIVMDAKKGEKVDHRNHNKLDNRKSELRICNQRQNVGNSRVQQRPKSSVFKGVCWYAKRSKWLASIKKTVNGKKRNHYLGVFTDEVSAARAYNAAALEHFGPEFALLNPI